MFLFLVIGFELFLSSFIKAAEEDENLDSEINNFLSATIRFLEDFDIGGEKPKSRRKSMADSILSQDASRNQDGKPFKEEVKEVNDKKKEQGFLIMNDLFGGLFNKKTEKSSAAISNKDDSSEGEQSVQAFKSESYKKIFAFLKTCIRTIAIAQSSCRNKSNLKVIFMRMTRVE